MRYKIILPALVLILATAIACGGPAPTPTLVPTVAPPDTPVPTAAPAPTVAPPTATVAAAAPITFSGTGDDIVDLDRPAEPALLRVTGNRDGRHFAVNSYDAAGNPIDLLVNTTEPYEGTRPLDFMQNEHAARLEVSATGPWTIQVLPLGSARFLVAPGTVSGSGDDVILVRGSPDLAIISGNPESRHFAVLGYDGGRILLVNTVEPYAGTVMLDSETAALEIQAVGRWTIEVTGR